MTYTTSPARRPGRINPSFNPGRRHHADFARAAVIVEFGWHHAKALDQGNFIDRLPGEMPRSSPETRLR